jgi:hypothetical protein
MVFVYAQPSVLDSPLKFTPRESGGGNARSLACGRKYLPKN